MSVEIKVPRKLIEVALPLDAINLESGREKSIRHGHPSTLHLWWARRPLAAARAILFAQLVNDPGYDRQLNRGVNKEAAIIERQRLFKIIEKLILWDNTNDSQIIKEAQAEIWKSWREVCHLNKSHPEASALFNPEILPPFYDPFAGGGAIPLEAQRIGLEAYASDINPVAVMVNKAMIEFPLRFHGRPPVGPPLADDKQHDPGLKWVGTSGLEEDVRRYGRWLRDEAAKRIGKSYPKVTITKELSAKRPELKPLIGQELTVVAWIWARTIKSPSPAFSKVDVPLVSTFELSTKDGKEVYVEPIVKGNQYTFEVKIGKTPKDLVNGTKLGRGANFKCIFSDSPIEPDYVKAQGLSGKMGITLMAMVVEAPGGRIYLSPQKNQVEAGLNVETAWRPDLKLPNDPRSFWTLPYGITSYGDLFTKRQLLALNTFSDLVEDVISKCRQDALNTNISDDGISLADGGTKATAYAQAIGVFLAFAVDKASQRNNTLCTWESAMGRLGGAFGRQTIPMTWDFAETNPLAGAGGDIFGTVVSVCEVIENLPVEVLNGHAFQQEAQKLTTRPAIFSTDPPYYDNIPYADLSEFFYIWLRRSLKGVFPDLLSASTVPKDNELVASPYRHGGKENAEHFFLSGMTAVMGRIAKSSHPAFPITIYYAFKQSETKGDGTSSTGWETFLEAVLKAGFSVTATWPIRTELTVALKKKVGALASSIVLACRPRKLDANTISRREFIRELNLNLPLAIQEMTAGGDHSPVAPVDLSQAVIGPGMAIFSKYQAVLEADGGLMSVKTALQLINRLLS